MCRGGPRDDRAARAARRAHGVRAPGASGAQTIVGPLMDSGKYLIKVPEQWNGTLILYSFGPPVPAENPVYDAKHPVVQAYLARGYAVAGWSSPVFWPLEQSFPNQMTVLDEFARLVGKPERTIAYGQSIGGFLTAGLAQTFPKRLDGALAICGPIAGGVATQNRELDLAFVFKTLIAPDSDLDLVRIRQPGRNQALSLELLEQAAAPPEGRARLALAAGVTNIPGWPDPRSPEPAPGDHAARLDGQIGWLRGIVFHVIFNARATIEHRAGGNPHGTRASTTRPCSSDQRRRMSFAGPTRPHRSTCRPTSPLSRAHRGSRPTRRRSRTSSGTSSTTGTSRTSRS